MLEDREAVLQSDAGRRDSQEREAHASMTRRSGQDDAERLRVFKAEFFKALGHPLRIQILELLRSGPLGVTQILAATGAPGSSVSQQLGILRARSIVTAERRGTSIIYSVVIIAVTSGSRPAPIVGSFARAAAIASVVAKTSLDPVAASTFRSLPSFH